MGFGHRKGVETKNTVFPLLLASEEAERKIFGSWGKEEIRYIAMPTGHRFEKVVLVLKYLASTNHTLYFVRNSPTIFKPNIAHIVCFL